jgi:hypothetical protein
MWSRLNSERRTGEQGVRCPYNEDCLAGDAARPFALSEIRLIAVREKGGPEIRLSEVAW